MRIREGRTREEFIEYENNPSHYLIEDPHANMSRKNGAKGYLRIRVLDGDGKIRRNRKVIPYE